MADEKKPAQRTSDKSRDLSCDVRKNICFSEADVEVLAEHRHEYARKLVATTWFSWRKLQKSIKEEDRTDIRNLLASLSLKPESEVIADWLESEEAKDAFTQFNHLDLREQFRKMAAKHREKGKARREKEKVR